MFLSASSYYIAVHRSNYLGYIQQTVLKRISMPDDQGSVVQSIISLTSSLLVKMLTVLVSTISNSQDWYFC